MSGSSSIFSAIKAQKKLGIFVLLFFPILIKLGFWQLDRATEKQSQLAVYQEQRQLPVKPLAELSSNTQVYYGELTTIGEFDTERYWLLDNQPRDGQVGYEVVMPFFTEQGLVMVNRGWVPASLDRTLLPVIETPEGIVEIRGSLAEPTKNSIINNNASDLMFSWPKRVLQLDIDTIEFSLDQQVATQGILRIKTGSPGAFVTDWPIANSTAEKHQGYAMQWFAMALALITLYGVALIKNDEKSRKETLDL